MKVCILGAAGFLGQHLEYRLKRDGHFVASVARKAPSYRKSVADEYYIRDLTNPLDLRDDIFRHSFDGLYQLASEVGGLGHIADAANDAAILTNSVRINLNVLEAIRKTEAVGKVFFASSQCVYPDRIEVDPFAQERIHNAAHRESDAHFDTFAFGQEKLFAEKLYDAYSRNCGIKLAIARIGNTYGPYCTWDGPRTKAPAAICAKVARAYAGSIELWGDGSARRSFTYVDDTIEGMIRLMASDYSKPVNIAHPQTVTIAELFETICSVAGKILAWKGADGPVGAQARGSDNSLCREVLGWEPETALWNGLPPTYDWIAKQALTKAPA